VANVAAAGKAAAPFAGVAIPHKAPIKFAAQVEHYPVVAEQLFADPLQVKVVAADPNYY